MFFAVFTEGSLLLPYIFEMPESDKIAASVDNISAAAFLSLLVSGLPFNKSVTALISDFILLVSKICCEEIEFACGEELLSSCRTVLSFSVRVELVNAWDELLAGAGVEVLLPEQENNNTDKMSTVDDFNCLHKFLV